MQIDAAFEGPLEQVRPWAEQIESKDLIKGVWVSDTTNDPFLLATLMATATTRPRVGTNIAVAFARSPYCLAQTAYNLAHLTRGRFVLGLGTQVKAHIAKRFSMTWPEKPVRAMVEYVTLLRHLFQCFEDRTRPNFRGETFSCTLNSPVFTPDKHEFGAPKVGFSAVGPVSTRAAGRVADSVFLHPFTHVKYLKDVSLPALAEGKARRDDKLNQLEVVGSAFCLATDSKNLATEQAEVLGRLAFYASTPNYRQVVDSLGYDDLHDQLHQLSREGKWAEMARLLPADFVEACVVMASKADLPAALEARFGSLYDRVVVDGRHFL